MKNIFLTMLLFIGIQMIGQKKVTIINNSQYTLQIGALTTIKYSGTNPVTVSSGVTYIHNALSPAATSLNIPAGGTYVLNNTSSTTKFPFVSVGNIPQITQWRLSSPVSTVTSATAYAAANATSQVLCSIKFQLVDPVTGAFIGGQTVVSKRGGRMLNGSLVTIGSSATTSSGYGFPPTNSAWSGGSIVTLPAFNTATPNAPFETVINIF